MFEHAGSEYPNTGKAGRIADRFRITGSITDGG